MTINGPAATMLAFFLNAAIDQQVEKHLDETAGWDEANKIIKAYFREGQPEYAGELPEGGELLLESGGGPRREAAPEQGQGRPRPAQRHAEIVEELGVVETLDVPDVALVIRLGDKYARYAVCQSRTSD